MKKKIMVVDDEENVLKLIQIIFEKEGYDVIGASNGKECLEKLKTVKPDLIIMDLMMPELTGKETAEKIRRNPKTKNLKMIFLTVARLSDVGKKELRGLKVLDYITKPFDNSDLIKRVKNALE